MLRIYGEARDAYGSESSADLAAKLHRSLRDIDPLYRDLGAMLGIKPLRVSLLPAGVFDQYYEVKRKAGAPLTDRRPARMNASDDVIAVLCGIARSWIDATEEFAA